MKNLPSVNDIQIIHLDGTWPTKSGGMLRVLYKIDYGTVQQFLDYDQTELDKIPVDIRGLRSYVVSGISKGSVGANEWHKVRNELCYCLKGSFTWSCLDTYGNKREFIIDENTAILTPHHILHIYTSLEDDSAISVLANTLFFPENSVTHDTYSADEFIA